MLLRQIAEARLDDEADVTSDKARWGLDDPRLVVILRKGTSREWKLNAGDERVGVVYVTTSDRPNDVMAVRKSDLAGVVNLDWDKFWSRKLLEANPLFTRRVTLTNDQGPKTRQVTLERTPAGSFTIVKPPYGPAEMEPGIFSLGGVQKQSPGVRGLLNPALDLVEAAVGELLHLVCEIQVSRPWGSTKQPEHAALEPAWIVFQRGIEHVALIGFEILVATLQAYVFAVLTCIYLHDAVHLH